MLIVLHGLPGVGKSTLAEEIKEMTGGMVLGSNYIRRRILECDAYACANVPLMPFSEEEINLSYKMILYCAELVLTLRKTVIMDATFQKLRYIEMAREIADKTGHKLVVIKVVCDEETCKKRLDEREKNKISDSIVGYAHHIKVKEKVFEEYPNPNFVYDSSKQAEPQYQKLRELLQTIELSPLHYSAFA